MCQCTQTLSVLGTPTHRYSVHEYGLYEAERHKWIESEKAGRDLGQWAIRSWVREHWNGFLRDRWLQHLEGRAFWIELDQDDFGLLLRAFRDSPLITQIVDQIREGQENLNIINWAIDNKINTRDVLDILLALDMNSRRIECLVEVRLAQAG